MSHFKSIKKKYFVTYFSYIINVKNFLMKRNNKLDKADTYRLSQEILRNKALAKGVNLIAPETIFLSKDTTFGKNVTVEPYVVIGPNVKIGDNSYIKSFSHIEGTKIEKSVTVGPYARLRNGTILKNNSKIGNFVETKKSTISQNSKVNHLSYVGDASVGKNSNMEQEQLLVIMMESKNLKQEYQKMFLLDLIHL